MQELEQPDLRSQAQQAALGSLGQAPSIRSTREREARLEEDKPSWGETWRLARENQWLSSSFARQDERRAAMDADYTVTPEDLEPLATQFNRNELDYLAHAVSLQDFQNRQEYITEDRERHQRLNEAGLRGLGLEFMAAMVDPSMIPLMFTPVGAGRTASLGARLGTSFAVGAAEGAAVETLLLQGDTQRDWSDVVLSTAASGAMSSAFTGVASAGSRLLNGNPRQRSEAQHDIDLVRDVDVTTRQLAESQIQAKQNAQLAQRVLDPTVLDAEARVQLRAELEEVAQGRMNRADRVANERAEASLDAQAKALREELSGLSVPAGGTKRARAAAAASVSAKRVEVQERLDGVQAELDAVQARLEADEPLQQAWQDISRLENGGIPQNYKGRLQEIRDSLETPLNKAERKALEGRTTSVGAAQVEGAQFLDDLHLTPETGNSVDHLVQAARLADELPTSWQMKVYAAEPLKEGLQSAYTTLNDNPSNYIRGINAQLNNDPQGMQRGRTNAAVVRDTTIAQIKYAEGGRERAALEEYAKEQRMGVAQRTKFLLGDPELRLPFDNQVVQAILSGKPASPAIERAAQARSDTLNAALEIRKEYGEEAFRDVVSDPKYWPFLPDHYKMQEAIATRSREAVEELMTKSYMTGRYRLPEKSARIIAQASIERTVNRGLKAQQKVHTLLSGSNRELLVRELREAGLDDARVNQLIDDLEDMAQQESINSRAKMSLGANMLAEHNGLRMVDILDTSQGVTTRYTNEAAGGAAIASQGYGSRRALEDTISLAEQEARNLLTVQLREAKAKGDTAEVKRIQAELDSVADGASALMDTTRLLYGESLDTNAAGEVSTAVQVSRATRKATNILRLGWNAFASIGEHSNMIAQHGLITYMRHFPKSFRLGIGSPKETADLQEIHKIMGAYGHTENFLDRGNYFMGNIGEDATSKFERLANGYLGKMTDHTMLLSGFRAIQNSGETLNQRAMLEKLRKAATGEMKYTERDMDWWYQAGMTPREMQDVFKHIRENLEKAPDGTYIFSAQAMQPELRHKLGTALRSIMSRGMQRNFIGDTSIWTNKELGKFVTQFRAFGLVSLEKQLVGGLRNRPVMLALASMYGSALAFMSYQSRVHLQAMNQDDPEQFIADRMHPDALIRGVLNMHSQLGSAGMAYDVADIFNVNTNLWTDQESPRFVTRAGTGMVPALGLVDQAGAILGGAGDVAGAVLRGEGQSDALRDFGKQMQRVLPYLNTTTLGTGFGIINQIAE